MLMRTLYHSKFITHLLILIVLQSSVGFTIHLPSIAPASTASTFTTQAGCACCGESCMCIKMRGACYCNTPTGDVGFQLKSPTCAGTLVLTYFMKNAWFLLLTFTAILMLFSVRSFAPPISKMTSLFDEELNPPPPRPFS